MEIDDQVARNLQAAAGLVDLLGKNPKTRANFLGMIKEVRPDVSIPEIDATKPLSDKIDAVAASVTELSGKLGQKAADDELNKERDRLRTKFGFTDEGIKELEKFMLDNSVPKHEIARLAMEAARPKAAPERPSFSLRSVFDEGDKDDAEWLANPEAKLDRVLNKAFEEVANGMAG